MEMQKKGERKKNKCKGMSKPHLKTFIDVHLTYLLSSVFVHFHGPVSITLKILSEVDFKNTFLFFNISIKVDGF